jgi:oligopeptide transport system ATP-binding protein
VGEKLPAGNIMIRAPLFELVNVKTEYTIARKPVPILHDISLQGERGKTLGIVGESGCGKSTLAKTLLFLEKPTSGLVCIEGVPLNTLSREELRKTRKKMQIVFQDPLSSLNPRMTCGQHIEIARATHHLDMSKNTLLSFFDMVHLSRSFYDRFPFELSGGQQQRVSIARSLSVEPKLLVLDEPLSSLDLSIRIQILKLFSELQQKLDLGFLFITHDLSTLRHIAHNVAVLYLGYLVEYATSEALYLKPLHPYTKVLFSSIPHPDPKLEKKRKREPLIGEPPSFLSPPKGCPFAPRCKFAKAICHEENPPLKTAKDGHLVRCHFTEDVTG